MKKKLSILLSVLMVLSLLCLAGCGGNKKKQEVRWTCCKNEKEITTKERSANVRRGFVAFFF